MATPDVVSAAAAAAAGRDPERIRLPLRGGASVLVRPVRPADAEAVRAGFELLSSRSRYLRFHAPVDELTDEQLHATTRIDHRDHAVWVAFDEDEPDGPVVGLASYVRIPTLPATAEAAVTVADRFQGRGLGTALLGVLVRVAHANGIEVFRNYVLRENAAMLQLFDELGAEREHLDAEVEVVDLAIPADVADLPDTPAGRAIRELGRGRGRDRGFLAALEPPLWARERRRREPLPPTPTGTSAGRERGPLADWFDVALGERHQPEGAPGASDEVAPTDEPR